MPVLQPYERTFLSHLKIEGRSGRQSQPGPSIKCFVGFAHLAFEDQQLNASRIWFAVRLSGRPPMYFNSFLVDRMQFFYSLPRRDSISEAIKGRVELCSVILRELPQLNEDRATIIRTRRVCGIDRVAHVGSGRVIAVFILEGTFQDKKFLSAMVCVWCEGAAAGKSNYGSGSCDLITDAVKHFAVDTSRWRRDPRHVPGVGTGAFRKVSVQPHLSIFQGKSGIAAKNDKRTASLGTLGTFTARGCRPFTARDLQCLSRVA